MKHRLLFFYGILAAFFWTTIPTGQASPEISFSLSRNHAKTGQAILLTIQAKWPASGPAYAFILPEIACQGLSVARTGQSEEVLVAQGREWTQKSFEIEFLAQKPGQGIIKAFELKYLPTSVDPDSSSALQTPKAFYIPDQTIQINADAPVRWPFIGLTVAALAILALFLRWRKKKIASKSASPKVCSEDLAIQNIHALISQPSTRPPKETLYAVSDQFRDFIIRAFHLSCNLSESEVITKLKLEYPKEDKRVFSILERLDQFKYSADGVTREDLNKLEYDITGYVEGKKIIDQS